MFFIEKSDMFNRWKNIIIARQNRYFELLTTISSKIRSQCNLQRKTVKNVNLIALSWTFYYYFQTTDLCNHVFFYFRTSIKLLNLIKQNNNTKFLNIASNETIFVEDHIIRFDFDVHCTDILSIQWRENLCRM